MQCICWTSRISWFNDLLFGLCNLRCSFTWSVVFSLLFNEVCWTVWAYVHRAYSGLNQFVSLLSCRPMLLKFFSPRGLQSHDWQDSLSLYCCSVFAYWAHFDGEHIQQLGPSLIKSPIDNNYACTVQDLGNQRASLTWVASQHDWRNQALAG